uniref:FHA domain-containing protein n=1 Tax=Peronospora matthiolae TaxID=2874970 RepID=A0AAV1SZ93_9STRA
MTVQQQAAEPWGRLTLVSKDPAEDSDHIYLTNAVTTIGRNKRRCDHVINQLFISSVHCVVQRDNTNATGEPVIKLQDNSRNGIWVNADRVGKGVSVRLDRGYTVHFTKPGATPAGVTPMAFKLEFLNFVGRQPVTAETKVNEVPDDAEMTAVVGEPFEAVTQCTTPADSPHLREKKRKRAHAEAGVVQAATQEFESKPETAGSQIDAVESQLKAGEAVVVMGKGLEQSVASQVDKLTKDNLDLMEKLEAASVENLQLKADLAAMESEREMKMKEAALTATTRLREELDTKQRAIDAKNKQASTKSLELDRKALSQEMAGKLIEETKKYQQKIEAEHYEQRREASEKMAALVNENEKLRALQSAKDEALGECEDKLTSLREKVTAMEKTIATKADQLAECENKVADLESKLAVLKEESAEIVGLLAIAEEKVVAAEDKATKADITAAAAARANANSSFDENERQQLHDSISSFRCELETYHAQLASREEECKKKEAAAMRVAITSPAGISAEGVTHDNNDPEVLRARLVAASDLFRHVEALGLQGMRVINGVNRSELEDLHSFSTVTVDTSTSMSNSSSLSPGKDDRHPAEDGTSERRCVILPRQA